MSTEKLVTRLWTKRVNLWLFRDIFHSALMHVDESRELVERVDNATLFKESCVNYINKKEMVKYWDAEDFFEKSKREVEGKLIPFSELEWIDCERSLSFVANYIHAEYKLYANNNNPSLLDIDLPEWSLGSDKGGVNYEGLILLIDYQCRVSSFNHIRSNLERLKRSWLRIQEKFSNPFWFSSTRHDAKCLADYQWVMSYFDKNKMINGNVDFWFEKNMNLKIHSIFDQWVGNKSDPEVELFIIKIKKAWSQKKFRDGVANKKVLNTYISKGSKRQLDYLASKNEMKINELIEMLINDAYAKAKLKSWEN
ncbi:hypothetical protein [Citrobacter portucalensis]|uniref:hypothetical protein n=1 Tax=Citrobacter portucalensis TaxID=1639133 RepID=UPI0006DA7286|nr:hypothetical protein [Citrobacter portucalensis]KAA1149310.1 hypothetical protein D3H39_02155 [Citrobacter portucalensis]OCO62130.1 hypothetical protein AN688_0212295 [Citrobacter freundii]OEH35718.1 hypothetical protein AN690_0205730 [Citrobacter freundii]HDU3834196.1 hypothetical protein [Klebsiella aerogenes]